MIFDSITNIDKYFSELPRLKSVKDFVEDFNESKKEDGTYKIDGDNVFAMVQSYKTKTFTPDMNFEAHKKYIDVQYIVSGTEKIKWAELDSLSEVEERYSNGADIAFYKGDEMREFILDEGMFLLLLPEDAHLPGLSATTDCDVRKIVFKVIAN